MHQSGSSDLDETIRGAATALNTGPVRQESSGEKILDKADNVYDAVSGLTSNGYVTATSDVVSAGMALLQPELDNFKSNCDILMKTLDAVAKVHPVVTVAVLAFKTAVTFEMTRRQNDKRIVALHVSMLDLMAVIGLLRGLAKDDRGSDGVAIGDRLRDRMQAIAKDIETCAATCDSFQKKKLIVKVFKSIAWEGKLEAFATAFDGHKDALHKDLAMHTALGIERANETLSTVDVVVKSSKEKLDMILLFQQLRSPDERELWKFIESKGGPDKFLQDDTLMNELIARTEKNTADELSSVNEVKYDVRKDLADIIKENLEVSENKFRALQVNIQAQMEQTVRREGDRIIGTLLSGPQDRIIDPNVWEIWHEMGWKGSAKARHLVMALREFYAERYFDAASEGVITLSAPQGTRFTPVSPLWTGTAFQQRRKAVGVRPEDRWTLDYITILRIQPLLEAFDDDASSFVTVSEVNAFTQARPRDWSLPHWMAYWTVGYPLSMKYYHDRIQRVVSRITELSGEMLPVNRAIYDRFQGSGILGNFELILAAAYKAEDHIAWDPQLFDKFKSYVITEEKRMKETLETIKYRIDAPTTLTLLLGSGRLEKHLLPLMYLMYHRYLELLTVGRTVALHRDEVLEMLHSSQMIKQAMKARLENVKAMCIIQNMNISDHLKKFAFGLYYYVEFPKDWVETAYYKFYYQGDSGEERTLAVTEDEPIETDPDKVLLKGRQEDGVDLSEYEELFEPRPICAPAPNSSALWHCCWRGYYMSDALSWAPMFSGHLDIDIPSTDGTFSGRGVDSFATFSIFGKRVGRQVAFTKTHDGDGDSDSVKKQFTWEGTLNEHENELNGRYCYGRPVDENTVFPVIGAQSGMGSFKLKRRPLYYYLHRPPDAAFDYNKARALWRYALNSVQHAVRAQGRRFPWDFVQDRRDRRAKYVERYMQLDELNGSWKDLRVRDWIDADQAKEMLKIEMTATVADIVYYRSLARCIMLREVIHAGVYCFVCCRAEGFPGTRITCLQCTSTSFGVEGATVDLCAEHTFTDYVHEDEENIHRSDHRLIQVRKSVSQRLMHKLVERGNNQVQLMDSFPTHRDEYDGCVTHPTCLRCKQIPSQPYWYCLECSGESETYICILCNLKDEAERLSRFASREDYRPAAAAATRGHKWTHSMILWLPRIQEDETLSVEDRLSTLEQNMRDLEETIKTRDESLHKRIEGLEKMVMQLVTQLLGSNAPSPSPAGATEDSTTDSEGSAEDTDGVSE